MSSDIRIIAGTNKSTKLNTLEGDNTRPTTGRIVENIFNIISHNKWVDNFQFRNQKILDIFAGSGRLGLEALSRGAKSAVFVDNNPQATKIIYANIQKCHHQDKTKIVNCDVKLLNIPSELPPFSLIFCDAPYHQDLSNTVLQNLIDKNYLCHDAIICIETQKSYLLTLPPHIHLMDKRDYGITSIHFLKYNANNG